MTRAIIRLTVKRTRGIRMVESLGRGRVGGDGEPRVIGGAAVFRGKSGLVVHLSQPAFLFSIVLRGGAR